MIRLIPGKTKVKMELFKGVQIADIFVGAFFVLLVILILLSNLPAKLMICLGVLCVGGLLIYRMDGVPNYNYLLHILKHFSLPRSYRKHQTDTFSPKSKKASKQKPIEGLNAFTGIAEDFIEYAQQYYGTVIEILPVEFRFFSEYRRENSIENGVGRILRTLSIEYAANIVKIERPIHYDTYLENEQGKLDELRIAYENGFLGEEEFRSRVEVLYDRIEGIKRLNSTEKVIGPCYYIVLFDSDKKQLTQMTTAALDNLRSGEMVANRLNSKELALFLKYSNQLDVNENELEELTEDQYASWAMPDDLQIKFRTVELNRIVSHNFRISRYPSEVGDAWMAGLMSIPNTKVVIKCTPMDRTKAIRSIDRSLQELRERFATTGIDSRRIELQSHIETLGLLLSTLQGENESLLECNIYVTAYDICRTADFYGQEVYEKSSLAHISNLKKVIRRTFQESGFRLNNMEFDQTAAYLGGQISGYDPLAKDGQGIPSNSLAATFPWIYAHISDPKGVRLGTAENVPVFVDFFTRNSERVNSNMVIVGKSGSGKSYATKTLLTNLSADDSKIFILDPENEYSELADNLHGKFINAGNAQHGRLNPFHIITNLDDDENEGNDMSDSYATHLQFLEEFFRQILPDCEKDAMEYLNSLIDRMYTHKGITSETNLSTLEPEDYPIFDDLYDTILEEFQSTDNGYIRRMLRILINYISKFSTGGRNSSLWNGPSTVTTEENFTVFNFQSLLANRNGTVANAQMLLVLKYIDNEIIKNRDYNTRYHLNRKIVVVIDEAHVFIDTKFPVALDFMFQLAKRIRKYNGMQIVITQNIKDFVGSEEIARKSTAIINACQYSFIFALSPNDMDDLCKLYEKSGGINENEQEQIVQAGRGQVFTVMSPVSRTSFKVEATPSVIQMFSEKEAPGLFFTGEEGDAAWEEFLGDSRTKRDENPVVVEKKRRASKSKSKIIFEELDPETAKAAAEERQRQRLEKLASEPQKTNEEIDDGDWDGLNEFSLLDDFDIPDDPEEFERRKERKKAEKRSSQPPTENSRMTGTPIPIPLGAQPPAVTPELEQVVSRLGEAVDNMSRISYESMMREVQRMIQAGAGTRPAEGSTEEGQETGGQAFAQIDVQKKAFYADGTPVEDQAEDTDLGSDDEFNFDNDFDIMSLLTQSVQEETAINPIEMMYVYNQEVITVTLEEMVQYLAKKKNQAAG